MKLVTELRTPGDWKYVWSATGALKYQIHPRVGDDVWLGPYLEGGVVTHVTHDVERGLTYVTVEYDEREWPLDENTIDQLKQLGFNEFEAYEPGGQHPNQLPIEDFEAAWEEYRKRHPESDGE